MNFKFNFPHNEQDFTISQREVIAFRQTHGGIFSEYLQSKELQNQLKEIENYSLPFSVKHFIHVGVGGSSLGAKMLKDSLGDKTGGAIFFDHLDAEEIKHCLEEIDLKHALFYFVSKSGNTIETLTLFTLVAKELRLKNLDIATHCVFCTDEDGGEFAVLAKKEGARHFTIPKNLGGRYSVLSPVGLFPAKLGNIDILALLAGAQDANQFFISSPTVLNLGKYLYTLSQKGIENTVMMPYCYRLKVFSHWFVQLWAESLGKEGKGLTPIPALGPADQHSQMQNFLGGMHRNALIFLKEEKPAKDYFLEDFSLSALSQAQLAGTQGALQEAGIPFVEIAFEQLDAKTLGFLIQFFFHLTVTMAFFFEVNPFDQPHVERGKVLSREFLRSK